MPFWIKWSCLADTSLSRILLFIGIIDILWLLLFQILIKCLWISNCCSTGFKTLYIFMRIGFKKNNVRFVVFACSPGGIPARNFRGERILLYIGIIDILQSYRLAKKLEHAVKSLVHDGVSYYTEISCLISDYHGCRASLGSYNSCNFGGIPILTY